MHTMWKTKTEVNCKQGPGGGEMASEFEWLTSLGGKNLFGLSWGENRWKEDMRGIRKEYLWAVTLSQDTWHLFPSMQCSHFALSLERFFFSYSSSHNKADYNYTTEVVQFSKFGPDCFACSSPERIVCIRRTWLVDLSPSCNLAYIWLYVFYFSVCIDRFIYSWVYAGA